MAQTKRRPDPMTAIVGADEDRTVVQLSSHHTLEHALDDLADLRVRAVRPFDSDVLDARALFADLAPVTQPPMTDYESLLAPPSRPPVSSQPPSIAPMVASTRAGYTGATVPAESRRAPSGAARAMVPLLCGLLGCVAALTACALYVQGVPGQRAAGVGGPVPHARVSHIVEAGGASTLVSTSSPERAPASAAADEEVADVAPLPAVAQPALAQAPLAQAAPAAPAPVQATRPTPVSTPAAPSPEEVLAELGEEQLRR